MNDLLPAKFSAMTLAIERMTTAEDGKKAVAMADAMATYAKRMDASVGTRNAVEEFRLRATRKFGMILEKMPKQAGARGKRGGGTRGSKKEPQVNAPPTLAELAIPKKLSSRAQRLAAAKDEEFEAALVVQNGSELNGNKIEKLFAETQKKAARQKKRVEAAKSAPALEGLIVGDFRKHAHKVADGSVSLIFTDPPYDQKAIELFSGLAEFAAKKLADGGSLIMYCGHLQLPAVFKAFDGKLRHWWTCACVHSGELALMREYGVRVGWKPIIWFVKGTRDDKSNIVHDTVTGGKEKSTHEWQQAESEAAHWIEALCPKDGIVCDVFLGGGTTAVVAKRLKREWIAFEIDEASAAVAAERIGR